MHVMRSPAVAHHCGSQGNAIASAAATAQPVGQHATQVLQRAAGYLIAAAQVDFAAAVALFELDSASR
jgi:hypothetical protein